MAHCDNRVALAFVGKLCVNECMCVSRARCGGYPVSSVAQHHQEGQRNQRSSKRAYIFQNILDYSKLHAICYLIF